MRHFRLTKCTRLSAGLLGSLLFAIFTLQLHAQTTPASQAPRQLSQGYDKAHEITLDGVIQEVISKSAPGNPVGLHLLVAGSQGTVDAHLGPYVTKDTQEALQAGMSVQIVGAIQTLHGKNYLLARQVILSDRVITLRSENGFLVRTFGPRGSRSKPANRTQKTTQVENVGGAQ
jgi:hypothetical protein